jgi:hypothetical protein
LSAGGSRTIAWGAPSLGDTVGGVQEYVILPL